MNAITKPPKSSAEVAVRVACDVGGTFTDVCILNEATGRMHVAKVPTTPDPIDGVLQGIAASGVAPSPSRLSAEMPPRPSATGMVQPSALSHPRLGSPAAERTSVRIIPCDASRSSFTAS